MITPGGSQKRKVKSDQVKRLRSSLDFTQWGLQPFATQALCSKLALLSLEDRQISRGSFVCLAGVSAPGRSGTKNGAKQHKAQIQIPTHSTSVSSVPPRLLCLGPDAKAGSGGPPWRLHGAQGKVR